MSTLKADTIQNTSGGAATLTKQEAAKSLLNFDHINDTIKNSFNNSSVSDDGTGIFTASHTNNYGDALYYPCGASATDAGSSRGSVVLGISASSLNPSSTAAQITTSTTKFECARNSSGTAGAAANDHDRAIVQTFGDLA